MQNACKNHLHKIGKFQKLSPRENQRKDELMANISHPLDFLSEKQKLKNKGNYVGNLTGKSQGKRLQHSKPRVSFVTLSSWYRHFCRNSRELP